MNKLFVFIVRQLGPIWQKLGADPAAVALILSAKLKMDDRGGYVMGQRQAPKSGMEFLIFFFMFLFGCMTIGAYFLMDRPADATGVIFCFWIIYIGLLLVTEMSNNLLDTRDLYILLTRPITDATLSLSRTLHIGVFTAKFALCLGFPVFVFMIFYFGVWAAISFFIAAVCTIIMTMVGTLGCYLLLLRYAPAHKVKRWVGYLQIVLTTVFFVLYQLPNLFSNVEVEGGLSLPQITGNWWGYLFPGLWAGSLWGNLNGLSINTHGLTQAIIALLAAAGGLYYYVRQSSGYGQQLLEMDRAGSDTEAPKKANTPPKQESWFQPRLWIGNTFTQSGLERASLNFHWRMMQRDLDFKQRTLPSVALFPIMMIGFVGKAAFDESSKFTSEALLTDGKWAVLTLLYTLALMVMTPAANTKSSKHYQASWIFSATPLKDSGATRYGQFLAVLGAFFLPVALVIYLGLVLFLGPAILPDIFLSFGVVVAISLIIIGGDKSPPFSQPIENNNMNSLGYILLSFFLTGVFGFGHFFLGRLFAWPVPTAAVLLWLLIFYQVRDLRRQVK